MERKKDIKKSILAFILVCCTVFLAVQCTILTARAASSDFDRMNVMDDLMQSTVNGKAFDVKEYPYNEYGEVSILNVVEYCYSYKANMRDNYALYIYVYNPCGYDLDDSGQNKIQIAVSYNSENEPTEYHKFQLKLCSVSEGNYAELFLKYKVIDEEVNGTVFSDRVNTIERRYDISGIELISKDSVNAKEYSVGGTYYFTGYSKGYGADKTAESTLSCRCENFETIRLKGILIIFAINGKLCFMDEELYKAGN